MASSQLGKSQLGLAQLGAGGGASTPPSTDGSASITLEGATLSSAGTQEEFGVKVSKAVVYAVLQPPIGISASKAVIYAVLQPLDPGVNVSKVVVYAVIQRRPGGFLPFMARFMG